MPHGRHRHSPPLHRLMPPTTIAVVAVLGAGGTWVSSQALVLRALAAVVALAALAGSFVMRRWDSVAGLRVAELGRAREADRWRHEEQVAELESELEESRELRAKLAGKLRAKRGELSALRGEHAALLRRYATAETERASALEGRRQLAIEASTPARALLPAAPSAGASTPVSLSPGARDAAPAQATAGLYARANAALDRLASGPRPTGAEEPRDEVAVAPAVPFPVPVAAAPITHGRPQIAAATAVAPAPPARRSLPQGGFDFFGTQAGESAAHSEAIEAVQREDLADVVGHESVAQARAQDQAPAGPQAGPESEERQVADGAGSGSGGATGEVIDLTAHDETEQFDVVGLRQAMRA
ncbi:hypothetical protein AB0J21_32630 [Streptomyces sp. NPDC049954]|uniref:hypothetical protein n=1 Tax=Streptomyces sp. NPDC049954 TaxID=3155779 RepID=UPI0034432784